MTTSPLTSPALAPEQTAPEKPRRRWPGTMGVLGLAALTLAARWLFSTFRQLVPDETYYWVWSQHPALSYIDHPPMIAWLIRLGTHLHGDSEFGVRWPMAVMAVTMVLILWRISLRLCPDNLAAGFVATSLFLSPMVGILGSIATPDTPAMFFQTAALACVLTIFLSTTKKIPGLWVAFGLFMGLALDSKYTSVLLGISVLIALLIDAKGREQLRTRWPWIAAGVTITVFSPVIIWNAMHHWASFAFQLRHGLASDDNTRLDQVLKVLDYFGSQLAIATPLICGLCVAALGIFGWRMIRGRTSMNQKLLVVSGALPLIFFALTSIHKRGNGNWPLFAYLPATLLVAQYLSEKWDGRRAWWARTGIGVAAVCLIVIHLPEPVMSISPKLGNPQWDRLFGWRELAQKVQDVRQGSPIYTTDYEYASELSFYLPDHPAIWPLSDLRLGDHRPTVFDQIKGYTPPADHARVLLVRMAHDYDHGDKDDTVNKILTNDEHFTNLDLTQFDFVKCGRLVRTNLITIATK
jgi:4-amino-4-deoxy-L-arabinose transferase-like glycosyltransferase